MSGGSRAGNYEQLLSAGRGLDKQLDTPDANDVKLVLYTSGTTGRPKAVLHSHNTLMRVLDVCTQHWGIRPGTMC